MDKDSLQSLIESSQKILFKRGFVYSVEELKRDDTKIAIKNREHTKPEDVVSFRLK